MNPMLPWLKGLRKLEPRVSHLSPKGAHLALHTALDALDPLPAHLDGAAPAHTVFVASRTVFTAPLEWLAVLLGRGGRVTLKTPVALLPWFEQLTGALPLTLQTGHDLPAADLVIAMGSDATVAQIRASTSARFLGFGSRYSVAWWSDPEQASAMALDLVLHDGRGCMSPTAIFSPIPDAASLLHHALCSIDVPRGALAGIEAARIRERSALAQVLGSVHQGADHTVLSLPIQHLQIAGQPRLAVLHPCPSPTVMLRALVDSRISVIGTDTPLKTAHRCTPLGTMQAPPLERLHDGVDWLSALYTASRIRA